MRRLGLCLLACIVVVGCGRGHATGPDGVPTTLLPAPTVTAGVSLSVVSGETGAPLEGARIIVSGVEHRSDASGHVTLGSEASRNAFVDVLANGFLDRQTKLRESEFTFTAWPRTSPTGLDEGFTRITLYGEGSEETPLVRLVTPSVTFVPGPRVAADPEAMRTLRDGAAVLGGMLPQIPFLVADEAGSSFSVRTVVDPDDALFTESPRTIAFTSMSINQSWELQHVRVVYRELRFARDPNVAHHEFGHVLGLNHSPSEADLMHCCSAEPVAFSARERLLVNLAYQRRPGTRFPDNDRDSISAGSVHERVIVCGGR